jgi:putative flavoprotein involved in K+ transport
VNSFIGKKGIEMLDVLIIGGGQAGLALGYQLQQTRQCFQIVARQARTGDNWRSRYDSLTLFTPRAYSALPGLALSGDPNGYPTKDEFAAYLEKYAEQFQLPLRLGVNIQRLEQRNSGFWAMTGDGQRLLARQVVLATGPFQQVKIPRLAQQLADDICQLTAVQYRNPGQIPPGAVLVVGDGASGRDIAAELSGTHRVLLATGRPRRLLPERILGRSSWWWLDKLGILRLPAESLLGRRIRRADPFPNRGNDLASLRRRGIQVMGRLLGAHGRSITFADGETARIDAVIWATGFRDESDWVAIPAVKDVQGNFIQRQGISPVTGLYFIGRSWQRTRGSALVLGVGEDARRLAAQLQL